MKIRNCSVKNRNLFTLININLVSSEISKSSTKLPEANINELDNK